jgi:hypothetical protein
MGALVLQIVLALVVLAGLITAIMSIKNWHWAQMLLLLAIFFSSLGTLVLGLEVYRINRNVRASLPALEARLAEAEARTYALKFGGDAAMARTIFPDTPFDVDAEGRMPGIGIWTSRLQEVLRQRGPAWRNVRAAGNVDPNTNRIPVQIENFQPPGLEQDAIVYLFEEGDANIADPAAGSQYLGEFQVVQVTADGGVLEAVFDLDERTGNRLAGSQRPWILYDAMPTDTHEAYAGLTEEQLRAILPEATVGEYITHGETLQKPDTDAFDPTIATFDEQGNRLGPNDAGTATQWRRERRLRDYAYLFTAANRQLVKLTARQKAVTENTAKLNDALELAKQMGATRTAEKNALTADLANMERDRQAIEAHLAEVERVRDQLKQWAEELQGQAVQFEQDLEAKQQLPASESGGATPSPQAPNRVAAQ